MVANVVSDNNPDGTVVAYAAGKLAFYSGTAGTPGTAITRPLGIDQAAFARGQAGGTVATYSSLQTPAAVAQSTTAEQSFTIQTGTGAQMLLTAGDVVYVNKPTQQAGLGVGNVRVVSSNTLGVTFSNIPAGGNITPTASQSYTVVALRGLGAISATLSPASVAANSIVEQQFTITASVAAGQTGLVAGQLVQVIKPTAQAGLDIVGCRVVSNGILGITFLNATAAPIVPTASESYTVISMAGLDAIGNEINYGFNVGTVGAIGAGVVATGGSTTLTGLATTDTISAVAKPTTSAAATNAAYPITGVPTANTLTLLFAGIGTGATPTASEVYTVRTLRPAPVAPLKLYSQTLNPTSVAALTTAEQTFTVTGLVSGSAVWINKPTATNGLGIAGVRVSATDTLAINFVNSTSSAITPPSEAYVIGNFQVAAPGAGNSVFQTASIWFDRAGDLLANLRNSLTSLGLIAGA